MIDPDMWHLTLAFLGEIDGQIVPQLSELIAQTMTTPLEGHFVLDSFQTFPPKHPTLVVAKAELEQRTAWNDYVERLRDLISMLVPRVDRKPWHPHITIARSKKRTRRLPLWQHIYEPIHWSPEHLALVHSALTASGPKYAQLEKFPFTLTAN